MRETHDYLTDRKESLQAIKDYLLSLLKKRKQTSETTKELEETLKSETTEELQKKQEENFLNKMKKKLFDQTQIQKENNNGYIYQDSTPQLKFPPEDKDEYLPQDMEVGETNGEQPHFGEIYPAYHGYYPTGKKSYFDPKTNLRSKRKQLSPLEHHIEKGKQIFSYAGYVQSGITAIPLPESAMPDTSSLVYHGKDTPLFQKDQNNCIYITSKSKQIISFQFALNEKPNTQSPIGADNEKIIFSSLTKETQELLKKFSSQTIGSPHINPKEVSTAKQIGYTIAKYINTTKKYATTKQGTLRNQSHSKNYLTNLDKSPILECFSANSLCVALCRELGIPARLIVGHHIQSANKDGKGYLSTNNGHARTEIRDGTERIRLDATPLQKENGENAGENGMNAEQGNGEQGNNEQGNNEQGNNEQGNREQGSNEQENNQQNEQQNGESSSSDGSPASNETNDPNNPNDTNDTNHPNEQSEQQENEQQNPKGEKSTPDNSNQSKDQGEMSGPREQKPQPAKSAEEMLDDFINKAKEESLTKQADNLKEALEHLEQAENKEQMREVLNKAKLEDFAKEMLDDLGNKGIIEEEKEALKNIEDEKELEKKLKESLLDPERKKKLEDYADIIRKNIEEQKRKLKTEMERFGFKEEELALYKQYKQLEKEVRPEVKKQIAELQKILPPNYLIQRDEENLYHSGSKLDRTKLVNRKITGDTKLFHRSEIKQEVTEINMFETIIIDRSGSMGSFSSQSSPFFQSIKAAITRAKVLEHFKVQMGIVVFDDSIDEVMKFGETFSDRKTHIPSKLMRAATKRSGGNSQEPITLVYSNMKRKMKESGGKSFGNISFIGDGDLYNFNQVPQLQAMIKELKKSGMGITAYYINNEERKMPLIEYYFGPPEEGNTIYAKDSPDLSAKIIGNHRTKLSLLIKKYLKQY